MYFFRREVCFYGLPRRYGTCRLTELSPWGGGDFRSRLSVIKSTSWISHFLPLRLARRLPRYMAKILCPRRCGQSRYSDCFFSSFANKPFCNSSSPSCSPLWFQSHYILSPRTRCDSHLRCQISSLSVVLIPCPMFHPDKATTPSNNQDHSRPSPSKQGALQISSSQNQKPIPSIPKLFCNITAHQRFLAKS